MIRKTLLALAAVTAFGVATVETASAFNPGLTRNPGISKRETTRGVKPAPIAYQLFCFEHRNECRSGGASTIPYNAETMGRIAAVNRQVNAAIRPKNDKGEVWSLNPASGDCEDYALTKRSRLIRAGFPPSALRMAIVTTPQGVRHAVLVVKTTSGDYVLDNLRKSVVKRQFTGYRFREMATADPRRWTSL